MTSASSDEPWNSEANQALAARSSFDVYRSPCIAAPPTRRRRNSTRQP